ncbi:MAG: tRNA lysidine(34) synthetase TilS [Bacteroidaceae bacterium]|nr:tRNA lysidine(34) synthetase TilS [Bacteroidaceae bacterium]
MKREEFAAALVNKVRAYIEREIGLPADSVVFIALSGGADSTALLLIMKELGYRVKEALHCNFRLRDEESHRDQLFVEELCKQQHVPLHVRHFDTEEVAQERGISIEMAARELRYDWFREKLRLHSRSGEGEAFVAVAHHRDDQAETMLLNLLRGTGLRGMAGMQPKHEGIIRPLLCLSREEILQYLASKGQAYVTDSTNSERVALRNRIRLDVVPMLRGINPSAVEHLCLACDNVRQSIPYYIKGIETAFTELGITAESFPLSALNSTPSSPFPHPLLHEWLAGKGFNRTQEEDIMKAEECGRMWHSGTHTILRDREALLLAPRSSSIINCQFSIKQEIVPCIGETGANIAYFDADLLTAPIAVRPVREGDSFVPFGMKGRKLISDYLTDRKINRLQKAETFVATCGDDIIWLIGHRSDNRFRVTENTKRILKLVLCECL